MRISVIGLPGSGKTTLADKISKKLSIPHIHLDRFWFEAGGLDVLRGGTQEQKEHVRGVMREKIQTSIARDSWVSDGFYYSNQSSISNRADIVVYLDIPLWRRLLNHGKRMFRPATRHKELQMKDEITFFYDIIKRQFITKPKVKFIVEQFKSKIVVLHSRKEIDNWLSTL